MSSIEQENVENEFKLIIRKNFVETEKYRNGFKKLFFR